MSLNYYRYPRQDCLHQEKNSPIAINNIQKAKQCFHELLEDSVDPTEFYSSSELYQMMLNSFCYTAEPSKQLFSTYPTESIHVKGHCIAEFRT